MLQQITELTARCPLKPLWKLAANYYTVIQESTNLSCNHGQSINSKKSSPCRCPCFDLGNAGKFRHARLSALAAAHRSEEHTSELQSRPHLVCRLLLEKKK